METQVAFAFGVMFIMLFLFLFSRCMFLPFCFDAGFVFVMFFCFDFAFVLFLVCFQTMKNIVFLAILALFMLVLK